MIEKISHYTITPAVPFAGHVVQIDSSGAMPGPGSPTLTAPWAPDGTYDLPFQIAVQLVADISEVSECGTWDYDIDVVDVTSGWSNKLRHRFEIGLKEVRVVESDETWVVQDLGSPYTKTKTFTVENLRPTSVDVFVNTGGDPSGWAVIDGGLGANLSLAPKGDPGSSATFTVGFNQSFDSFPAHTPWNGFAAIHVVDHQCRTHGTIYRNVTYIRGEETLTREIPIEEVEGLPLPVSSGVLTPFYGERMAFDFAIQDSVQCVGDLDLSVGFISDPHLSTMSGEDIATVLEVRLIGPSAATAVLWNAGALPSPEYLESRPLPWTGFQGTVLKLDQESTPPTGLGALSSFYGLPAAGAWRVELRRAYGNAALSGQLVAPAFVELDFKAGPCSNSEKS